MPAGHAVLSEKGRIISPVRSMGMTRARTNEGGREKKKRDMYTSVCSHAPIDGYDPVIMRAGTPSVRRCLFVAWEHHSRHKEHAIHELTTVYLLFFTFSF